MAAPLAGFPHWEVRFDAAGASGDGSEAEALVDAAAGLSDLLVLCHGWNNDTPIARRLYARLLEQVRAVLDERGVGAGVGTAGVLWPSMRWPDEEVPNGDLGGAAAVADLGGAAAVADLAGGAAGPGEAPAATGGGGDADAVAALRAVYPDAAQRAALDELGELLARRPADPAALARFQQLMAALTDEPDAADAAEDAGERALLAEPPEEVFARFAAEAPASVEGGAAGLGDVFGRLWDGAKEALRQATYWQMKKRAGTVGRVGLGPLLGRLVAAAPPLRVHLVGHSFGARLVSFAVAGVPDEALQPASPVKSLVLLQGAFSHFAFADALPHDRARAGALRSIRDRVDGPVVVTHSTFDRAVGTFYPLASLTARDDAAALSDRLYRWGAMGYDGAQAVGARDVPLAAVGQAYPFARGAVVNLDGNQVITRGGPPSGAHSDIFHPEVAWAVVAAAGLAGT